MARYEELGKEKGLYKYKFYWNDPFLIGKDGKRKRRSKVEKLENKSDYKERLYYYEKLENDTEYKQNFNEVVDKWYNDYALNHYKNIKDQDSYLKFIRPYFSDKKIIEIKATDINVFLNEIRNSRRDTQSPSKLDKKVVSESTVKNYYHTLKSIFDFATEHGYVENNVIYSVKKIKISKNSKLEKKTESDMIAYWKQVFECLTEEVDKANEVYERRGTEYSREAYFQKIQFRLIVLLTFETGLRAGEVIALRYKDIDLKTRQLTIQYQLKNRKLVPTKMKEEKEISRVIELSNRVFEAISEHKKRSKYRNSEYIFTTQIKGEGIPKFQVFADGSISQTWKRFLDRNQVELQRFHDIRHDFATLLFINLAENDVELRSEKVKDVLGHANADFTRRQYIHYAEKEKVSKDVVEATNKTFNKLNIDI